MVELLIGFTAHRSTSEGAAERLMVSVAIPLADNFGFAVDAHNETFSSNNYKATQNMKKKLYLCNLGTLA